MQLRGSPVLLRDGRAAVGLRGRSVQVQSSRGQAVGTWFWVLSGCPALLWRVCMREVEQVGD